jgi:hypothetical protein
MSTLIALSDVTTVCPVFKDKTGDFTMLKGICFVSIKSERCTKPTCVFATRMECEIAKREKRPGNLDGYRLVLAEE